MYALEAETSLPQQTPGHKERPVELDGAPDAPAYARSQSSFLSPLNRTQADFRDVANRDVGIFVPGSVTAPGLTPESPTVPGFDAGYHAGAFATLPRGTFANGVSVHANVAPCYAVAGACVYFVSGESEGAGMAAWEGPLVQGR